MKIYEAASYIAIFGFASTLLTNSFLISLTIWKIKQITGTYKWMIVIFAIIGIIFSIVEVTTKPCVHNFNGAFMFFSLNLYLPKWLMSIGVACYGGFFCSLLAFVTMQFLFRCWTLVDSNLVGTFRGFWVLFWALFVIFPCAFFAALNLFLVHPDEYSDGYLEEEILEIYELPIQDIPRFIMIVYGENDEVRWKNVSFVISVSTFLSLSLLTIAYCAFRMRKEMNNCIQLMSRKNQKLETQFFYALLAQSAFPTCLLALPTGPVMLLPFFNLKISLQSGMLPSLISLYPPMDSIAMMLIIKEYKGCILDLMGRSRSSSSVTQSEIVVEVISASEYGVTRGDERYACTTV